MPASVPHILVAWSGADAPGIRALLSKERLPVLGSRLAAGDRLTGLGAPSAPPFALAVSLITGIGAADHAWLAPVQPDPTGNAWQPACAARLSAPPLWDRLAAAGRSSAALGWPCTHGAALHPLRALASDLDLAAVDTSLRPLDPLAGSAWPDALRIRPDQLDAGLLGFFIPRAELPANPATDPVVRALMRHLARIYSAHNTAIDCLQSGQPPSFLAVHYELPAFSPQAIHLHPRLHEATLRLLDLLLGDLLRHAPDAALHVVGLATAACFLVSPGQIPAPQKLDALAPSLLAGFDLSPNHAALPSPPAPAPGDDSVLLQRYHALGLATDAMLQASPSPTARLLHSAVRGRLLLSDHRPAEALPLLAPAYFQYPEEPAHAFPLYECLHALGLRDEALEPAESLRDHAPTGPSSRLIEAEQFLRHQRQPALALTVLAPLLDDLQTRPHAAPLHREALLHLRRFAEARPLLETAIADGSATADTHAGLAYACFRLGDLLPAETAARAAFALGSSRPQPARILEHLAARRSGQRIPAPAVPDWGTLLANASRRDEHRAAYARLRADFITARAANRATRSPVTFTTGTPALPADAVWTIVTGAHRSGRALLLRMLAFGGFPVLTDGIRPPDTHNPCGYFEWTPAARLKIAPDLIDEAANHALKLPPEALGHLPRNRRYRVLFVTRDPAAIIRSQAAVLSLHPAPASALADLAGQLDRQLAAALTDPNFDVLEVPYDDLRAQPVAWAARLAAFLGSDRLRRPAAMPAAVHPDLPRHRA